VSGVGEVQHRVGHQHGCGEGKKNFGDGISVLDGY